MFKQGDSASRPNERLLLSTDFTTKCELVFVLTQESASL